MPEKFRDGEKDVDPTPLIVTHEVQEQSAEDHLGKSYTEAHEMAIQAEKFEAKKAGVSWKAYNQFCEDWYHKIKNDFAKLPPDLDMQPYVDSPEDKELVDKMLALEPELAKDPAFRIQKRTPVDKEGKEVKPRRVATVAIRHGHHLLMGKRRDNGKWTMPGGHLDEGETFHQGALREVEEETGIELDPNDLYDLTDVHMREDKEGKPLHVQAFHAPIGKRPPTTMKEDPDAEVHRWQWINTEDGIPDEIYGNMHVPPGDNIAMSALGLVRKEDTNDDALAQWDMQQIVHGMDYEQGVNNITDDEMAHDVVLSNLADDPDYYRKLWLARQVQTEPVDKLDQGLNLDLGSGQARASRHIGIDTYPYDANTIVHDLNLGIPFPDESAGHVRMVNSYHDMDLDDPKALLSEIQRVLMPGGFFYYEGPSAVDNYPEWLQEVDREEAHVEKAEGASGPAWVKQTLQRIAFPDQATANDAEPRTGVAQYDMLPADALLAIDAVNYDWSDATTSGRGNRIHGYPSQGALVRRPITKNVHITKKVPIFKANKAKQIVYCVVLSPEESDLQEDYMTAEDIEATAHNYMLNARKIGSMHEREIHAAPVESYIAPLDFEFDGGQQYGPQKVKKGAWIIGIKVFDPDEWAKVEDGTYQGVSVGGMGLRERLT